MIIILLKNRYSTGYYISKQFLIAIFFDNFCLFLYKLLLRLKNVYLKNPLTVIKQSFSEINK